MHLVNAFDYVAHVGDITGYYFTTPSGKWRCAILHAHQGGLSGVEQLAIRPRYPR